MKILLFSQAKMKISGKLFLVGLMLFSIQLFTCESTSAQTKKRKPIAKKAPVAKKAANLNLPVVTQIDTVAFKNLLKREVENTKPLLINFWATWCVPCREEFPDLVKIDADYKGKIDFITVSLDEVSELKLGVPKFLASMKATMPAYLLKTNDEGEAIGLVSKDWQGALPFTILFDGKGGTAYSIQGRIKPDVLRAELARLSSNTNASQITRRQIVNLPIAADTRYTFENGKTEAQKDVAAGKLIFKRYGLTRAIPQPRLEKLKEKYGVEIVEHGCLVSRGFVDYVKGYNEISATAIKRKFGNKAAEILGKL